MSFLENYLHARALTTNPVYAQRRAEYDRSENERAATELERSNLMDDRASVNEFLEGNVDAFMQGGDPRLRAQYMQQGVSLDDVREFGNQQVQQALDPNPYAQELEAYKSDPSAFQRMEASGQTPENVSTSNIRDITHYNQMPENTEEERKAKALMKQAISRTQFLDTGIHHTDTSTGKTIDKNIIETGAQEGEIENINAKLDKWPTSEVLAESFITDIDDTIGALTELENLTSSKNVGWAGLFAGMPESEAGKWRNLRDTITARFALDKMMELKSASPTGSTGFGALNEKEMLVMQNYMGNLENTQDPKEAKRIIRKIINTLESKRNTAYKGLHEGVLWFNDNAPKYRKNSATTSVIDVPATTPGTAPRLSDAKGVEDLSDEDLFK